eukprot:m.18887 g.18887  ORF g.18887 m.18887 type:complete len:285 (-) comp5371_c0_seq1:1281-2135(-)
MADCRNLLSSKNLVLGHLNPVNRQRHEPVTPQVAYCSDGAIFVLELLRKACASARDFILAWTQRREPVIPRVAYLGGGEQFAPVLLEALALALKDSPVEVSELRCTTVHEASVAKPPILILYAAVAERLNNSGLAAQFDGIQSCLRNQTTVIIVVVRHGVEATLDFGSHIPSGCKLVQLIRAGEKLNVQASKVGCTRLQTHIEMALSTPSTQETSDVLRIRWYLFLRLLGFKPEKGFSALIREILALGMEILIRESPESLSLTNFSWETSAFSSVNQLVTFWPR